MELAFPVFSRLTFTSDFSALWTACGCSCVALLSLAYSSSYFTLPLHAVLDRFLSLLRLSGIDLAVGSRFFLVFKLKLDIAQRVPVNGMVL